MAGILDGKVALVTGAGSGIGRATAVRLAREGATIALVGREAAKLEETMRGEPFASGAPGSVYAADIGDPAQVAALARTVIEQHGRLDILINAAGMNVSPRSIADGSIEDWQRVLAANVTGAYLLTKAFLAAMRAAAGGATVVNVVSDSGLRGNNFAGVAYIASKFGMRGLTEAINAEERHNGIRATSVYPGEVNTPILDRRPVPPPPEARAKMLQAEDVAECIALAVTLPPRAIIEDLVVRPAVQDWVSRR